MKKSADAFRTISEVAEWLGVQTHVLRFWESKFSQVKPVKRAGGRRYYRPADMLLLGGIRKLLHEDGLTVKGAQKVLREEGVAYVADLSQPLDDLTDAELEADLAPTAEPNEAETAPPEAVASPVVSEPAQESLFDLDPAPSAEEPEPALTDAEPVDDLAAPEMPPAETPAPDMAASTEAAPEPVEEFTPKQEQIDEAVPAAEEPEPVFDETAREEPGAEPETGIAAQEDTAEAAEPEALDADLSNVQAEPFEPAVEETPEPAPEPDVPAEPDGPRPNVIDAPDGPEPSELSATPFALSRTVSRKSLSRSEAVALNLLVAQLKLLRDRMAAEGANNG